VRKNDFFKILKTLKKQLQEKEKVTPYNSTIFENKTKQTYCTCKDSHGESKYLYTSQKELEYVLSSKELTLQTYPCQFEKGWHITKG